MKTIELQPETIAIYVSPGRVLKTTKAYNTYWKFAALRQDIFMRRVNNEAPPWTEDPVLLEHRFTNPYRASDRVSQYLIRNVIYEGSQKIEEVFFRTILFKLFNRIDTWQNLIDAIGFPSWKGFDANRYATILNSIFQSGRRLYSPAYIMPSPNFGNARKHRNHLQLLEFMMRDGAPKKVSNAKSLEEVFQIMRGYQSLGDFLAFQYTIDLNYSEIINFSEMDFVVAGPGARNGIQKCFADTAGYEPSDIIRIVAERAQEEFSIRSLDFKNLWGRKLQLIDCQNLYCEVDKYSRVVHPDIQSDSQRMRIKQKFVHNQSSLPQWYPPKWNVRLPRVQKAAIRKKSIESAMLFDTTVVGESK